MGLSVVGSSAQPSSGRAACRFRLSYSACGASIPGDAPCQPNGNVGKYISMYKGHRARLGACTSLLPSSVAADLTAGNNLCNAASVTGGFTCPGLDQIGNIRRNSALGPNFFNSDMSIFKNVSIYERVTAQFRMDAFNALTISTSGTPNGAIDSDQFRCDHRRSVPGWTRRNYKPAPTAVHFASAVLREHVSKVGKGFGPSHAFLRDLFESGEESAGKSVPQGLKPRSLLVMTARLEVVP